MAYDQDLADRLRETLSGRDGVSEKRMFGGLAFLLEGRMAVAASGEGLLLRCDPADTERHLAEPGIEPFRMRGKDLTGWLYVGPDAVAQDAVLARWVEVGTAYAATLPPS